MSYTHLYILPHSLDKEITMYSISGPPAIIDIEASGFGPDGYPIEIGVAQPPARPSAR
jgi:hypothetical protein